MPAYHVEKSIHIEADPQVVFETVADYGRWTIWSPWLIAEPAAKVTVSENANSVGSTYSWIGDVVGQGELEHKKLEPGKLIEDELRFLKPFKSICRTSFHMERESGGTRLTWNMDASLPWFLFWMIPMMKTFIGMDYARGLQMLKELIESGKINSQTVIQGPQPVSSFKMIGIASKCSVSEVGPSMEQAFQQAKDEFKRLGLPQDGQMISVYTRFRMNEGVFEYISGFIVPANTELPSGSKLTSWSMKATRAFKVTHIGSYHHLGNAWSVANQHVRCKKMKQHSCGTYELYVKSPPEAAAEEIETEIYLPLKS